MIIAAMLLRSCPSRRHLGQERNAGVVEQVVPAAVHGVLPGGEVLGVAREVPAVHVEEELRGGVQPGQARGRDGVGRADLVTLRVMLVGLGGAGKQREPDVVRAGRPLERPDANHVADERGLQHVEVGLSRLRVDGRVVLRRRWISEGVPAEPPGGSAMPMTGRGRIRIRRSGTDHRSIRCCHRCHRPPFPPPAAAAGAAARMRVPR